MQTPIKISGDEERHWKENHHLQKNVKRFFFLYFIWFVVCEWRVLVNWRRIIIKKDKLLKKQNMRIFFELWFLWLQLYSNYTDAGPVSDKDRGKWIMCVCSRNRGVKKNMPPRRINWTMSGRFVVLFIQYLHIYYDRLLASTKLYRSEKGREKKKNLHCFRQISRKYVITIVLRIKQQSQAQKHCHIARIKLRWQFFV